MPSKVDSESLEPLPLEHVHAMLDTCMRGKFTGERNHAIPLFLLDTGVRPWEHLALDKQDVDTLTGEFLFAQNMRVELPEDKLSNAAQEVGAWLFEVL